MPKHPLDERKDLVKDLKDKRNEIKTALKDMDLDDLIIQKITDILKNIRTNNASEKEYQIIKKILEKPNQQYLKRILIGNLDFNIGYGPISRLVEKVRLIEDNLKKEYLSTKDYKKKINIGIKIAKNYMGVGYWKHANQMFENLIKAEFFDEASPLEKVKVFRDNAICLTKEYPNNYEDGIKYMKRAIEVIENQKYDMEQLYPTEVIDLYSSLAGIHKRAKKHNLAVKWYRRAMKIDPVNTYPLLNVLIYELRNQSYNEVIKKRLSQLEEARRLNKKKLSDIEQNIDSLAWILYDLGTIYFLNNQICESINYYLLAIIYSQNFWTIKTTINTLELLPNMPHYLPDKSHVIILLLLALAFYMKRNSLHKKEEFKDVLSKLKDYNLTESEERILYHPTLVISGGTTTFEVPNYYANLKQNLISALDDFQGCIIFGSYQYSLNDLILHLYEKLHSQISFYEKNLLAKEKINFWNLTSIYQYWFDILTSNIDPNHIKFLAISGGFYSSLEFKIAIALGAKVGIFKDSGGEEVKLIKEQPLWREHIKDDSQKTRVRLYKTIINNDHDIKKFIKSEFLKEYVCELILGILIQIIFS